MEDVSKDMEIPTPTRDRLPEQKYQYERLPSLFDIHGPSISNPLFRRPTTIDSWEKCTVPFHCMVENRDIISILESQS